MERSSGFKMWALCATLLLAACGAQTTCPYKLDDCIDNCADLTDQCNTHFCPTCEKKMYCDTTCNFCSDPPTTTASTTRSTTPMVTTTRPQPDCHSVDENPYANPTEWCKEANGYCEQCNSWTLCDDLFCPDCPRKHECDRTCGFCSITSTTTTTATTTPTATTTGTTVTSTTTTSTLTTTSSTTARCYNTSYEATDVTGRPCSRYTSQMCGVNMDDADFTAAKMCCVCGGGSTSCQDTDFDTADSQGRTCAAYSYDTCGTKDDDDFNSTTMCCACGGGTLYRNRTTNITIVSAIKNEETGSDAAISSWWLLLLLLIPCLLCCCLAAFHMMRKKAVVEEEKDEMRQTDTNCFVIEEQAQQNFAASSMVERSRTNEYDLAMTHVGTARTQKVVGMQDTVSETTVYATACDLFSRPQLSPNADGGFAGGCCASRMESGTGLSALNGSWLVNGRPGTTAVINGATVAMQAATGRQDGKLVMMADGRPALDFDGNLIPGQLVGSRMVWTNGETWRRAESGGAQWSNSSYAVPAEVVGNTMSNGGARGGGGSPMSGSFHTSGSRGQGTMVGALQGVGARGYTTQNLATSRSYNSTGGSFVGARGGGVDANDIILRE